MKKTYLVLALLAISTMFSCSSENKKSVKTQDSPTNQIPEPQFVKEGELTFTKANGQQLKIDIEIADDDAQRAQGLMYRKSMSDLHGMLFIFSGSEPRYFWMKNTFIALDMLFCDENGKILVIRKDAQPGDLNSENMSSNNLPAMYVLEVNSGFTTKHSIEVGDKIEYKK